MTSREIFNLKKVDELISTAGQPDEAQLKGAAAEGFETVINLATIDPRYSLPDEEGLVRSLGLNYHHLPVDFTLPTKADFEAFVDLMANQKGRKTLIHCAANYRVTAFYSLYAMAKLGWTEEMADSFIASIWKPSEYPPWSGFIEDVREEICRNR